MTVFDIKRNDFPNPNNLDDMQTLVVAATFLIKKVNLDDFGIGMTEQIQDFLKDARRIEKIVHKKQQAQGK